MENNNHYQRAHPYMERWLNAKILHIPHEDYQRRLDYARAQRIADNFDDRLLNDPKVSFRDGGFHVFDGQTTLTALKILAGTDDTLVRCRVYEGMTLEDEARLFAAQFGDSKPVAACELIRAKIVAKDPVALAINFIVESVGLHLNFTGKSAKQRIGCIEPIEKYFELLGPDLFHEALSIMVDAWGGSAKSLASGNFKGICAFLEKYAGMYDRARLVQKLHEAGPARIYQEGGRLGSDYPGDTKYLLQVYQIYNGTSRKYALPLKF